MILTLNPGLKESYRKTVNDRQYVFEPQTPIEVNDADLSGMVKAIGYVLAVPKEGTFKADWQATETLKAMLLDQVEAVKPKAKKSK